MWAFSSSKADGGKLAIPSERFAIAIFGMKPKCV
jgi:hypothetical protein